MNDKKEIWIVLTICAIGGVGYFVYDKYIKKSSAYKTISWFQDIKNNF
jgi:hypothetical protein